MAMWGLREVQGRVVDKRGELVGHVWEERGVGAGAGAMAHGNYIVAMAASSAQRIPARLGKWCAQKILAVDDAHAILD